MFHVATRMPVSTDEGGFIKKVLAYRNIYLFVCLFVCLFYIICLTLFITLPSDEPKVFSE